MLREIVQLAIPACPSLATKRVPPHRIRHSTAIHLLQSGVDIKLRRRGIEAVTVDKVADTDQAVFEFSDNSDIGDLESAIDNAKKMGKHFARTHHVMTNPIIELNEDNATVRANLIATHVYRDDKPGVHYEVGMVYHFISVRTAQGWRFSHVKLKQIWSNGQWVAPQRA